MTRSLSLIRGAAVLVLTLLVAGCQAGSGPTGVPESGPETVTVNGVDLLVAPAGLEIAGGMVHENIGPDGGSISVDGGRLDVAAGALSEIVSISMKGREDIQYKYRFGPDGLVFDAPATLSISVDPEALGIDDTGRLKIAVASDTEDDWVVIEDAYWDEATGTVVAPVEHFSLYGLCLD